MTAKGIISVGVIFWCGFFVYSNEKHRTDGIIVKLPKGKIRGRILTSTNGSEYYAFQDIPYAAPPTGENRFQVPKEPAEWQDILDATNNTKICHRGKYFVRLHINIPPTNATRTEDCLYLNVYTPVRPGTNNSLPVFVFIHGGSFIFGDGTFEKYGPKHLMDHNIVVVTLNYRLDVLGFLTTDDGVIPGNLGLRDQNFALRWINENIGLFAGDNKKITLGGESAGSSSTAYHMLSKKSVGLFSSAILQSGTFNSWSYQSTPRSYAFLLGNILDKSIGMNSTKLLLTLKKASVADIMIAATKFLSDNTISRSVIRYVEITSRYVRNYFYKYSYGGETEVNFPGAGNVGHEFELRFIWDWTYLPDVSDFDNVMRQRMLKLWTNFIKNHDPTPIVDPLLLNAIWPPSKPGNIMYFNINETFSNGTNLRYYNEVKKILDQYVQPPLATY